MIRKLASFRRDTRGVAAIEMAFIMPFMLVLFFGLIDLTQVISLNRKVTYAASVVADLVTQNEDTVLAADFDDYFNAAKLVMTPNDLTNVRIEVYQFRDVGGTITNQWSKLSAGGAACGAPSTAGLDTLMEDGNDIIIASVCTTYTPYMANFLGYTILSGAVPMSEEIALRPRQSATLDCTGC